jgi:catechol 2,3-dioxygenase-like lactoylglutathione lyase family enzyme
VGEFDLALVCRLGALGEVDDGRMVPFVPTITFGETAGRTQRARQLAWVAQGVRLLKVLFIAGFGPIAADVAESRRFYQGALAIPFEVEEGEYLHTEAVKGANTFAVWPLAQAAESCFGTSEWPAHTSVPHAWLEFDVDDVEAATQELEGQGYRLLVRNRTEPWGQVVTRLLSPEGLLVGVTLTPSMRGQAPTS